MVARTMSEPQKPPRKTAFVVVALVLHLALGLLLLVSGLIVPIPYLILLWIAWGALLVSIGFLAGRRPWRALLAPAIAGALYLAVVVGLGTLLDWTA